MDFLSTESYWFTFIRGIQGAINTGSVILLQIPEPASLKAPITVKQITAAYFRISVMFKVGGSSDGTPNPFPVAYLIAGGNPKGKFALGLVQNEWKVYVKRPLDREEQDVYYLNITATDGLFVTQAAVEVTVTDVNDNSPVCEQVSGQYLWQPNTALKVIVSLWVSLLFTGIHR